MKRPKRTRLLIWLAVVAVLVAMVAVAFAIDLPLLAPVSVAAEYPVDMLIERAQTMKRCADCHPGEQMHTCADCHDGHGAVELAGVGFYDVILLTGDVPSPGYVRVADFLPPREGEHIAVPLLDVLAQFGVEAFESVTLASDDEGFVTIMREHLTPDARLMPYVDGVRFADANLHVSTWTKGITRIIVVGAERPLRIDGEATSMGRLLLGPTVQVTVDQTDVMLRSEEDGEVREAMTATRIEGAPIERLVANANFDRLQVTDGAGQEVTLDADEADGALLYLVRDEVTLVLPNRGRAEWVADVREIRSE